MNVNWNALLAFLLFALALVAASQWPGDPGSFEECLTGVHPSERAPGR